jgi:hypothetical protein
MATSTESDVLDTNADWMADDVDALENWCDFLVNLSHDSATGTVATVDVMVVGEQVWAYAELRRF